MADLRRIHVLTALFFPLLSLVVLCGSGLGASPQPPARTVQKYFAGTRQEVVVHTIRGENQGPTVVVFGGIHGDETSCSRVASKYTGIKLKKGNLIVVPCLNGPAMKKRKREGLSGDMNRLFHLPEDTKNPDMKVVNLAKSLIGMGDYAVNLHQGSGFYSPIWVDNKRNPSRWGQSNVIDAPVFDMPNGDRLEPGKFAQRVAQRINSAIPDPRYHFRVNNTNTASEDSIHKEQRKSLTYYALTKGHKMALALEATKNCSDAQAIHFLTIALNSVLDEAGVVSEELPKVSASIPQNKTARHKRRT